MPNPAALIVGDGLRPAGVAATVSRAPSTVVDTIDVQWTAPADVGEVEEVGTEPDVRWWCQPGASPAVGDYAMLMTDSRGDAVAFVFASDET